MPLHIKDLPVRVSVLPATESKRRVSPDISPKPNLLLTLVSCLLFMACLAIPRVGASRPVSLAVAGAAVILFAFLGALYVSVKRSGRVLTWQYTPRREHYVQLMMHSSIYAYWGLHWPVVYQFVPLLVAQILFLYSMDMLLCWSRRDKWILGFGPIPIVLSMNLFLWFRDDWFAWQFVMLTITVLGKEFLRWRVDGQSRHIFNPSAFSLSVFAVVLLATGTTGATWGPEIAQTLHLPPYIYIEIFLVGLVVQSLFSVTLVTLCAAASLCALNVAFTGATGVYYFIDSGIPVSVFLGLHLLVTDPATSPRTMKGKAMFGALYGVGVFALYGMLGRLGMPQFYDKLLTVPILNLMVPMLDRFSNVMENFADVRRWELPEMVREMSPRQLNLAHMGIWILLFTAMSASGFVGHEHPGQNPEFWKKACRENRYTACEAMVRFAGAACEENNGPACMTMAQVLKDGKLVKRNLPKAGDALGRACDLGVSGACEQLANLLQSGAHSDLARSCEAGDAANCFILGSYAHLGKGVPRDDRKAFAWFDKSCVPTLPRGCARLGEAFIFGEGTPRDPAQALFNFEKACAGQYGPACVNAGMMYKRGDAGRADEVLARKKFEQACKLGIHQVCQ